MKRNKLWPCWRRVPSWAALAACGSESDSSGSGDGDGGGGETAAGAPWILGTTDTVTALDPAGSYDFGSWNMQYNIFQQLMTVPANGDRARAGDAGRVVRLRRPADDHLHAAPRARSSPTATSSPPRT